MALTAAYEAFLDRPNKEVVVLAEVTPKDHFRNWSSVVGLSQTFSHSVDNFAAVDAVQGGIYRNLVSIVQGPDTLTEQSQPGFVEENAGSWYYNESDVSLTNLVWPSADLADANWGKNWVTISPDATTGPDGNTLVDKIMEVSGGVIQRYVELAGQAGTMNSGDKAVVQGYMKAAEHTIGIIADRGDSSAHIVWVDLSTGSFGTQTGIDSAEITDAGNGWYYVSIAYTIVTNGITPRPYFGLAIVDGSDTYVASTNTEGFYATGMQFVKDTTVISPLYVGTYDAPVTVEAFTLWVYPVSVSGGTSISITNYALWSEDYSNGVWPGSLDATAVQDLVAPGGGTTGWTLGDVDTGFSAAKRQLLTISNDASVYTYSIFVYKTTGATTYPGLLLLLLGGSIQLNAALTINTNNGTIASRAPSSGWNPYSMSITSWDSNWWRVSISIRNNGLGNTNLWISHLPAITASAPATPSVWDNAVVGEAGFWGSQLEKSSGVHTYLKTEGAPVSKVEVDLADSTNATLGRFRLHFSTIPKVFGNMYYEPRLVSDNLPSIHEEIEDLVLGEIKKVSEGGISLNNADGLFDTLTSIWAWKNAEVVLYIGGDDLEHTPGGGGDYEEIGSFFVEDFSSDLTEMTLSVRDIQKFTLADLPVSYFDVATYPNLGGNKNGTKIPLLFGLKSDISPALVDSIDNKGKYLIADPTFQTLYAINAVYDAGVEIPSGNLTKDLTGCSFIILNSYAGTPSTITCTATGQPVRGNAWETSTDYLKFYGEIVCEIYRNYLNVSAANIDDAQALVVDADAPSPQAAYIAETASARTYIRKFELGVLGRTVKTPAGVIKPTIWSTTRPLDVRGLIDPDIADFQVEPKIESIFTSLVVLGDKDPSSGDFGVVAVGSLDTTAKYVHLNGLTVVKELETFLKNNSDAVDLAVSVQRLSSNPSVDVKIKETGISLMHMTLGDKLVVTFVRAPSATGEWTEKLVEIVSITRSLLPQPAVEITVNDLRGVKYGSWTSDIAPSYTLATDTERLESGFWTDDTGRADPLNSSSSGISLWQ